MMVKISPRALALLNRYKKSSVVVTTLPYPLRGKSRRETVFSLGAVAPQIPVIFETAKLKRHCTQMSNLSKT
jgi:hypothetical protein